jgi:hypothetical protein
MARLSILLTFCVFAGMAQYYHPDQRNSVTDSLVDVFPLSIGNQWTYGYYSHFEDPGGAMWHWCDTGTVHLQITEKTVTLDSTLWLVQETKRLWWHYNDIWSGPHEQTDTFARDPSACRPDSTDGGTAAASGTHKGNSGSAG